MRPLRGEETRGFIRKMELMRSYKENVENLEQNLKILDSKRFQLKQEIQAGKIAGHHIVEVENWLRKAENVSNGFRDEIPKAMFLNGLLPNITWRYRLSYEAKKRCEDALRLLADDMFSDISYPAPLRQLISFKSRQLVKEILDTLKGEKEKIVGLCGMPGFGKTKMAEIVAQKAKEQMLFDKVEWVHVSQNPNLPNKIAQSLGLSLDENQSTRTWAKLGDRIKGKRTLLVLDELWEAINLDQLLQIGGGCKFLITTQSRDVCCDMKAKTFTLELLSDDESWNLFKESISDPESLDRLIPSAKEIIRECGGLPVAIIEAARRFDIEKKDQWMDAEAIGAAVSYSIMRSVKYFLKDDDDDLKFLICCLSFSKDSDIPIECLFRYQLGLKLFNPDATLEEARSITHEKVQILTRKSLLLPSNKLECTRIHNVVRKVIIQMASTFQNSFMLRQSSELLQLPGERTYGGCYALSIVDPGVSFLSSLKSKNREFLHLDSYQFEERKFADLGMTLEAAAVVDPKLFSFYGEASELKVVSAKNSQLDILLFSLVWLQELRTLSFDGCKVILTDHLGETQNLRILSFANSDVPELSINLTKLTKLRLLDLTNCKLETIPYGLLSGLSELEEFYVRGSFDKWAANEDKIFTCSRPDMTESKKADIDRRIKHKDVKSRESSIASLGELNNIKKLRVIDIHIPKSNQLPRGSYFHSLERFRISIGSGIRMPDEQQHVYRFKNHFSISLGVNEVPMVIKDTMNRVQVLELYECVESSLDSLDTSSKVFEGLEIMYVEKCDHLTFLLDATATGLSVTNTYFPNLESLNLKDLQDFKGTCHLGLAKYSCFGKLRNFGIELCGKLRNVVPLIVRDVSGLQTLRVTNCDEIEEIVRNDGSELEKTVSATTFSNLTSLVLDTLPNLWSFCTSKGNPQPPSSGHEAPSPQYNTHRIDKATLFSSYWIQRLPKLESLEVVSCNSLQVLFDLEGLEIEDFLNNLRRLKLQDLSKLTHVCKNVPENIKGLQDLRSIIIQGCPKLSHVFETRHPPTC